MNNTAVRVSVVIPLYNAQHYIEETIVSVLAQSFSDLEVIVVNNGSTDNSVAVVQKLMAQDARIQLLQIEENSGGPAKPRNVGIEAAQGDYIAFLDADDVWLQDKLQCQMQAMQSSELNFCSTHCCYIDDQSLMIPDARGIKKAWGQDTLSIANMAWQNPVITSSVLVQRQFLGAQRFDEDPLLVGAEDLLLWMELVQKTGFQGAVYNKPLLNYRVLANSKSRELGKQKAWVLKDYAFSKFMLKHRAFGHYRSHLLKRALRLLFRWLGR